MPSGPLTLATLGQVTPVVPASRPQRFPWRLAERSDAFWGWALGEGEAASPPGVHPGLRAGGLGAARPGLGPGVLGLARVPPLLLLLPPVPVQVGVGARGGQIRVQQVPADSKPELRAQPRPRPRHAQRRLSRVTHSPDPTPPHHCPGPCPEARGMGPTPGGGAARAGRAGAIYQGPLVSSPQDLQCKRSNACSRTCTVVLWMLMCLIVGKSFPRQSLTNLVFSKYKKQFPN